MKLFGDILPPLNLRNSLSNGVKKVLNEHDLKDWEYIEKLNTRPANTIQHGGEHYKKLTVQTWDYIIQNNIPYLEGNVIKYVSRWRDKGGMQDLLKAQHYLNKLIEVNTKE